MPPSKLIALFKTNIVHICFTFKQMVNNKSTFMSVSLKKVILQKFSQSQRLQKYVFDDQSLPILYYGYLSELRGQDF